MPLAVWSSCLGFPTNWSWGRKWTFSHKLLVAGHFYYSDGKEARATSKSGKFIVGARFSLVLKMRNWQGEQKGVPQGQRWSLLPAYSSTVAAFFWILGPFNASFYDVEWQNIGTQCPGCSVCFVLFSFFCFFVNILKTRAWRRNFSWKKCLHRLACRTFSWLVIVMGEGPTLKAIPHLERWLSKPWTASQ